MMGDIPIAGRQQKDAPTDEKSVHRTLFCTRVRTGAVLSSPSNRNQTKNPILPDGVLFGGDWGTRTLDLMRVKHAL